MTQYAVIDKATGEEVYRYEADAPIEWNEWEFATHDHVPVVEQAPIAAREPAAPHVEIRAGDTHVAAPEIHNHVAAAPAPVVQQDIHVQPAAAPVVENHVAVHVPEAAAAPSDAVRKIEIVSMPGIAVEALPDRQTTSEVERDAAGDIVSTRQTERDA